MTERMPYVDISWRPCHIRPDVSSLRPGRCVYVADLKAWIQKNGTAPDAIEKLFATLEEVEKQ